MTERRPSRRGRGQSAATDPSSTASAQPAGDANPYLDAAGDQTSARVPKVAKAVKTPRTPRVRKADADNGAAPDVEAAAPAIKRGPRGRPPKAAAALSAPTAPSADPVVSTPVYTPPAAPSAVPSAPPPFQNDHNNSGGDFSSSAQDGPSNGGGNGNGNHNNNNADTSDEFRGQRRGRYRRFRQRNRNNNQQQGGGQGQFNQSQPQQHSPQQHQQHQQHQHSNSGNNSNQGFGGRRNRRNRHQQDNTPRGPIGPVVVEGEATGWFDLQRDAGYIRNARNSYLVDPADPFVPLAMVRQYGLRRGDLVTASVGRDQRNRIVVADITLINDADPTLAIRRAEFQSLVASYPERKLTLETGKPAKGGPELTRRAMDLIAPIGYGQRALIVAPARAGKTMLLQAVIEGIAINHPTADLFVLLVDERPEEVSDMITLGYGEVIASSFDMPAARHTDVAEMTLERARRLVELGRDVVIVLDSITRLARAYNTVERGTGRTLSGGLDSSAMAKPKAFFGSARSVAPEHGGGSLTIIATALVETGSRMDDVIFEEFKGTGNSEIKLDRSLAEKRIFPAIDIGISGTRREDKLFRPDQLEHVYTLRRGLQQMPASSGMEWLIKRIASTTNNDALLAGL